MNDFDKAFVLVFFNSFLKKKSKKKKQHCDKENTT